MLTAIDVQMSYMPAAVVCSVTQGMTGSGTCFGWTRRDLGVLRNRLVNVVAKHDRQNPGSGVT